MSGLALRALLTYLVHSTVLLLLAALVRHALGERRLAVQEAVLRAALVGAFVTSGLQLALELKPLGGTLTLPAADAGDASRPASTGAARAAAVPHGRTAQAPVVPAQVQRRLAPTFEASVASARARLRDVPWRLAFTGGWCALATLGLLRLAVAALRLRALLRGREPIDDGPLALQAGDVAGALGLRTFRLSTAPRLTVPLATGVWRPEVCLPARVVGELDADEQLALCAHELAHVSRRDPAWILLAGLAEAVAPLQPLNRWARRRLSEISECLSDDLAVAGCARPVGLARSLVDVASWTVAGRLVTPFAAAGALSAPSRLGHRVERIMDPLRSLERPRRFLLPLAASVALATAFLTPVVSATVSGGVGATQAPVADTVAAPAADRAPAPVAPGQAVPGPPAPSGDTAPGAAREPDGRDRAELERRLEALGRRIEERARQHEGEMNALDREMQALTERLGPDQAELQRLGKEIEDAAADAPARQAEAARRMADLQRELRQHTRTLGREQARALAERARALAHEVRPNEQEVSELRRLARELAGASAPDMRDVSRQTREAMEQARRAIEQAAEAMRRAARDAGRAEAAGSAGIEKHE